MSRTVMTIGSFDILHRDHIALFEECRRIAGKKGHVRVGLNTDAFIESHKGRPPLLDDTNRALILGAIRDIDDWFWNENDCILSHIERFMPDFLVIGSDWHEKDYMGQIGITFEDLYALSCNLVYVPTLERVHSSSIREA